MDAEELRRLRRAEPFRPFTIRLADGRELHVPERVFFWVTPEGSRVCIADANGGMTMTAARLVASVEFTGRTAEPQSQGT
jgi:hypothetical protein